MLTHSKKTPLNGIQGVICHRENMLIAMILNIEIWVNEKG